MSTMDLPDVIVGLPDVIVGLPDVIVGGVARRVNSLRGHVGLAARVYCLESKHGMLKVQLKWSKSITAQLQN